MSVGSQGEPQRVICKTNLWTCLRHMHNLKTSSEPFSITGANELREFIKRQNMEYK